MSENTTVWPAADLEQLAACPFCASTGRQLAYDSVEDWSFASAPGRWSFWQCQQCRSLYLSPRPSPQSIGRAYGRYYTHAQQPVGRGLHALKLRLKNEFWFHCFGVNSGPRLGLPVWAAGPLRMLARWITMPFGLHELAKGCGGHKGLLIDVGCGNGDALLMARQLGWQTQGIEFDANAVNAARERGLQVVQGGFEVLAQYQGIADCLVCSHVLEHVHNPLQMLDLVVGALKPGGMLLIAAPNASSYLRDHYGRDWRGLEAPRHLAIPDAQWLVHTLQARGLRCTQEPSYDGPMATESERIRRRGKEAVAADAKAGAVLLRMLAKPGLNKQDLVQIVGVKERP